MDRTHAQQIVETIRELWNVATPVDQIAQTMDLPKKLVVKVLHELCVPIAVIARRVTLRPCTVKFVLEHGKLPETRLPLECEAQR